jgi:hypothetical protein
VLYKQESIGRLFDQQFGGVDTIIKDILCDFFKVRARAPWSAPVGRLFVSVCPSV